MQLERLELKSSDNLSLQSISCVLGTIQQECLIQKARYLLLANPGYSSSVESKGSHYV